MSNLGWLGAAFAIVWVAIGAYIVRLSRTQRDIARRLDQIERSTTLGPPTS